MSDPRRLIWPALLIVSMLPPFFVNDYVQYILNSMLVYAVVAVGFNIVLGYAGQLAFALLQGFALDGGGGALA